MPDKTTITIGHQYNIASGLTINVIIDEFESVNYSARPYFLYVSDTKAYRQVDYRDILPVSYTHLTLPTNREV